MLQTNKVRVIGKVYKSWEKPSPTAYKKIRQSRSNRRQFIGVSYPKFTNSFDARPDFVPMLTPTGRKKIKDGAIVMVRSRIAGTFDGKTAYKNALIDTAKKVKLSNKAKSMIQKDQKLTSLYNAIDKQFNVGVQQDQRRKTKTNKTNSKKYNRR